MSTILRYSTVAIFGFLLLSVFANALLARGNVPAVVPHPVQLPVGDGLSPATYFRHQLGRWGEGLAARMLKLDGWSVRELKVGANRGIDLCAVRRDAMGNIRDLKFVEVKAGQKAKLGMTKAGRQMTRAWLADNLKRLRQGGQKEFALEVHRFIQGQAIQQGVSVGSLLEKFTEVRHMDPASDRVRVFNPNTGEEKATYSLKRVLEKVAVKSPDRATRDTTRSQLRQLPEIQRNSRMLAYLEHLSGRATIRALEKTAGRAATKIVFGVGKQVAKILIRSAPVVGTLVSATLDAQEALDMLGQFQRGEISKRELVVQISGFTGGVVGAAGGAWSGALTGAAIGTFFGPVGTFVGGIAGGAVGGFAGYFGGQWTGTQAATKYFELQDHTLRDAAETDLLGKGN